MQFIVVYRKGLKVHYYTLNRNIFNIGIALIYS